MVLSLVVFEGGVRLTSPFCLSSCRKQLASVRLLPRQYIDESKDKDKSASANANANANTNATEASKRKRLHISCAWAVFSTVQQGGGRPSLEP